MNGAMDRVQQNQARLAEIATLKQTLDHVQSELRSYRQVLHTKLLWLRQQELAPAPATTAAPAEPEAPRILPMVVDAARNLLAQRPTDSERRASRRRPGNPISILITDATGISAMSAWVTDRSQTGLGLRTDEEEEIGAILRIRPAKSTEWTNVVVKHCRHDERGNWVMGCQFVEEVPTKQLRMFG